MSAGELSKRKALKALRYCGGDLTHDNLRSLGLWGEEISVLGQVLEEMGLVTRDTPHGARMLNVSVGQAMAAVSRMYGDVLTCPVDGQDGTHEYEVLADPHLVYTPGTILTAAFVRVILTRATTNGLELRAMDTDVLFRAYHGRLYTLKEGDMVLDDNDPTLT